MGHRITALRVVYEEASIIIMPLSQTPRGTTFMTGRIVIPTGLLTKAVRKERLVAGVNEALNLTEVSF